MTDRETEIAEYARLYQSPDYGMGPKRRADVRRILSGLTPGSYLDVSTGRGEALSIASELGYEPVMGTEAVADLCGDRVIHAQAHRLPFPDEQFEHVTCFDVLEHLVEDDILPALQEIARVAWGSMTVSASERPSVFGGRDLHISKRPAAEWLALIRLAWGPDVVQIGKAGGSPCFQAFKP